MAHLVLGNSLGKKMDNNAQKIDAQTNDSQNTAEPLASMPLTSESLASASHASIIACGINSPIGGDSLQTCAMLSSCFSNFEHFEINEEKTTLISKIPEENLFQIDADSKANGLHPKNQKLLQIATPALLDCIKNINIAGLGNEAIPLYLGLPQESSEAALEEHNTIIPWLKQFSGINIDTKKSRFFSMGRSAGIIALHEAIEHLNNSENDCIIVGAVDSLLDLKTLSELYTENRITDYNDNNGLIASESATFLIITESSGLQNLKIASIAATITGEEEKTRDTFIEEMPKNFGEMINQMLKNIGGSNLQSSDLKSSDLQINTVYHSFNGEKEWVYEWGACQEINKDFINIEGCRYENTSLFIGDTGAATGLLHMAIAADSISQGTIKSPSLISASSDEIHRAAAILV